MILKRRHFDNAAGVLFLIAFNLIAVGMALDNLPLILKVIALTMVIACDLLIIGNIFFKEN